MKGWKMGGMGGRNSSSILMNPMGVPEDVRAGLPVCPKVIISVENLPAIRRAGLVRLKLGQ
jgi:hypothetical protein